MKHARRALYLVSFFRRERLIDENEMGLLRFFQKGVRGNTRTRSHAKLGMGEIKKTNRKTVRCPCTDDVRERDVKRREDERDEEENDQKNRNCRRRPAIRCGGRPSISAVVSRFWSAMGRVPLAAPFGWSRCLRPKIHFDIRRFSSAKRSSLFSFTQKFHAPSCQRRSFFVITSVLSRFLNFSNVSISEEDSFTFDFAQVFCWKVF